jgi:hypothetical protein
MWNGGRRRDIVVELERRMGKMGWEEDEGIDEWGGREMGGGSLSDPIGRVNQPTDEAFFLSS